MNWKKYVEDSNEIFNNSSKSQKRVMIAQDVIARVEAENLIAKTGTLVEIGDFDDDSLPLKEAINSQEASCSVCAKGSLLCAFVGRVNKFTIDDITEDCILSIDGKVHRKLKELFTPVQLDLMEIAFEGKSYLMIAQEDRSIIGALNFYGKYDFQKERLLAIMQNLILNQGTFKP